MTKKVTRLHWDQIGKPAPKWLIKLILSWNAVGVLVQGYMVAMGMDDHTVKMVDHTFIFVNGLFIIFIPITGVNEKEA